MLDKNSVLSRDRKEKSHCLFFKKQNKLSHNSEAYHKEEFSDCTDRQPV